MKAYDEEDDDGAETAAVEANVMARLRGLPGLMQGEGILESKTHLAMM